MPIYAASTSQLVQESVAPPPPDSTALTLAVTPSPALTTSTVTLNGNLSDTVTGAPVANVAIYLQTSIDQGSTWLDLSNVLTDANGDYTVTTQFPRPGAYGVRASFAGSSTLAAATSGIVVETITAPQIQTALTLAIAPNPALLNQSITMSGRLVRLDTGAGIAMAIIQILVSDDQTSWTSPAFVFTDSNGDYTYSLSFNTPGTRFLKTWTGGQMF